MRITITVNCDNDAFGESGRDAAQEVNRILTDLTERLHSQADLRDVDGIKLRDINGNTVGRVLVDE